MNMNYSYLSASPSGLHAALPRYRPAEGYQEREVTVDQEIVGGIKTKL